MYSAHDYGVVANGSVDDTAAWNTMWDTITADYGEGEVRRRSG